MANAPAHATKVTATPATDTDTRTPMVMAEEVYDEEDSYDPDRWFHDNDADLFAWRAISGDVGGSD